MSIHRKGPPECDALSSLNDDRQAALVLGSIASSWRRHRVPPNQERLDRSRASQQANCYPVVLVLAAGGHWFKCRLDLFCFGSGSSLSPTAVRVRTRKLKLDLLELLSCEDPGRRDDCGYFCRTVSTLESEFVCMHEKPSFWAEAAQSHAGLNRNAPALSLNTHRPAR